MGDITMRKDTGSYAFHKNRLEALSDGIFAIAMTLLVLDLKVPEGPPSPHFALQIAQEWIGVIITFILSAIFWTLQHRVFELADDLHERVIVPTFIFLGLISVLPFSTGYFSHHIGTRSAYILYFSHAFLISAALLTKLQMLVHYHMPTDLLAVRKLRTRLITMCFTMGIILTAACLVPVRFLSGCMAIAAVGSKLFMRRRREALERADAAAAA